MTGSRDRLVEPGNSTRLAARLIAADNAATVLTYRHVGHFAERAANAYELRNRDTRRPPRTELWVILPDFAREIAVRLFDCAALPYTWRVALRDVISARRRRRRASDSVT